MNRTTTYCILLSAALLGLFSTANATPTEFTFGRTVKYTQSGASTVTLVTDRPYRGEVDVNEDSSTSVFNAGVLTLPNGATSATINLSYNANDQTWAIEDKTSSLTTLNADIPVGDYSLTLTKLAGGTTVIPFTISSLTFPTTPVISNYTALQSIDATSALTISWGAWTAGTANDFIIVRIENASSGNTVYEIDPGQPGALTGTATSVTIPANTLASGISYNLSVQFVTGTTFISSGAISDYPSAMKAVYNAADTQMTIATTGSTSLADLLTFSLWNNINYTFGTINGSASPTTWALPGTSGETLSFTISDTTALNASQVTFTDPSGSALSNTAATKVTEYTSNGSVTGHSYQIDNLTPYLANGTYTVDYNGTPYTGTISNALTASDRVYFVPTITLNDGKITSISWATYDSAYASLDISGYSGTVMVQIQGASYNSIYQNDSLSPSTTSIDLSSENISIYDVGCLYFFYCQPQNDAGLDNQCATTYWISVSDIANIFSTLTHIRNWVSPYATEVDSFGWFYDASYPWIYSASADKLANDGTYVGDGKGWLYIYAHGATLSGGFYLYRSATSSWAWTNYNWHGWIYDYGTSSWVDLTPAIQ